MQNFNILGFKAGDKVRFVPGSHNSPTYDDVGVVTLEDRFGLGFDDKDGLFLIGSGGKWEKVEEERKLLSNGFRVGDRVRRKDGRTWDGCGDSYEVVTVMDKEAECIKSAVYAEETGTWRSAETLELVTETSKDIAPMSIKTEVKSLSRFTEKTFTTETIVKEGKAKVKSVTDGELSNGALMSVVPDDAWMVRIVVGARFSSAFCSHFTKPEVAELIKELQAVHVAMK